MFTIFRKHLVQSHTITGVEKLSLETRSKIQAKRQAKKDKQSINKVASLKENEETCGVE